MTALSGVFAPRRVAVVGATDRDGAVGRAVMENLIAEFDGEVIPVNPNHERLFDRPCVDSVADTDADLAVVAVPADVALEVIETAGAAGIDNVVVLSAGFAETGSEGAAREQQLAALAEEFDLTLVGPNSLGVISTPSGLNATFAPRNAPAGTISFMSQSGAFVTAVIEWAAEHDIGFKDVVSLGNKAVLDELDFLEAWSDDPATDVVLGYLESIERGRTFVETGREITRETPVVLVKSGRTDAGAHAAASHTGAIAGSETAYEAGLAQAGVLRADSVEELFDYGTILAGQPLPATDDVAVVTNAGGPGVMATDAIGESGLSLARFTEDTRAALRADLPAAANVQNPVDVIGDAPAERFRDALATVLADPGVGAAVVIACPSAPLSFATLADSITELEATADEPLAVCLMGGESTAAAATTLAAAGISTQFDPARSVDGLDALRRYREIRERPHEDPPTFDVDRERARAILDAAADRGETRIGLEAMGLLEAYGIPIPEGKIVDGPREAERVADRLGGDVVMKIVSPDILHKTDIGGVEVGVAREDIRDTYESLVARARQYQPDATLYGVQVQAQVDLSVGVETIAGATRDPQFGPLVLFGLGGVYVEVLEDTSVRIAPVSDRAAAGMIDDLRAAPLLRGARGRDPVDEAAVVGAIQRLAQLVVDFPAILELDINPLVATPAGVTAIDIRLTIDPEEL